VGGKGGLGERIAVFLVGGGGGGEGQHVPSIFVTYFLSVT